MGRAILMFPMSDSSSIGRAPNAEGRESLLGDKRHGSWRHEWLSGATQPRRSFSVRPRPTDLIAN